MKAPSFSLGGTRRLPTTFLVARREVRMRLRSRVFVGGTIVMTVLVVVGIVAASLLAGRTNPVRVGFSGGSQALEPTFTASAAALGAKVTISDIADVNAGEAQVTAGTLDVPAAPDPWEPGIPGIRLVQTDGSRRLFELDPGVDDQALLQAGLKTGPVREFERVEPTLGEIFRTVIEGAAA